MRNMIAVFSGFVLASVAGAAPMSAQMVEILPEVGVNLVTYTSGTDDVLESDTGIGFEAGVKVRIGGRFFVEGGGFWTTSGADVTSTDDQTTDGFQIQDFRVPVVLGLKIIQSRAIALRVFGGAYPAFVTGVSDNDFGVEKEDLESAIWSGRAGAGLDFTLLTVDAGYDFGLSDVFKPEFEAEGVKRNGPFLEAGLRFGF